MFRLPLFAVLAALTAFAAPAFAQSMDPLWATCETKGDESCDQIAADPRATPQEKATANFDRAIGLENAAIAAMTQNLPSVRDARRNDALAAYARAVHLDPANAAVRYNEARLRHGMNDKNAAFAGYTAVIDLNPLLAPDAYALRARVQVARGDLPAALADANESVRRKPNAPQGYLVRAEVLRRQGDEARADADEARGYGMLSPSDKQMFTEVGEYSGFTRVGYQSRPTLAWRLADRFARGVAAYAFAGSRAADAQRAVKEFDVAVTLAPDDAAPYQQRGEAWFAAGDAAKALVDFDHCVTISTTRTPDFTHACLYGRGKAREAGGDTAAALPDYDAAVAAKGDNANYRNGACWARAVLGQELDRALADCNEAVRLRPTNPGYLDSRGLVQLRAGRFAQAEADYAAALSAASGHFEHARYGRGIARLRQGKTELGQADIAAALAAEPGLAARFAGFGQTP